MHHCFPSIFGRLSQHPKEKISLTNLGPNFTAELNYNYEVLIRCMIWMLSCTMIDFHCCGDNVRGRAYAFNEHSKGCEIPVVVSNYYFITRKNSSTKLVYNYVWFKALPVLNGLGDLCMETDRRFVHTMVAPPSYARILIRV